MWTILLVGVIAGVEGHLRVGIVFHLWDMEVCHCFLHSRSTVHCLNAFEFESFICDAFRWRRIAPDGSELQEALLSANGEQYK